MTIDRIRLHALTLKSRYATPEEACGALDIRLLRIPMGREDGACKGFFLMQSRIKAIVLNADISPRSRSIILAHELGHAVLHAESAGARGFHDFSPFDETDRCEYEANLFAAEFLLDDKAVLEALNGGASFFDAAKRLRVPPELLDFKFRVLKRMGCIPEAPCLSRSNFMKHVGNRPRP